MPSLTTRAYCGDGPELPLRLRYRRRLRRARRWTSCPETLAADSPDRSDAAGTVWDGAARRKRWS